MSQPEELAISISAVQRILEAAQFAARHHATQKRKGEAGEPYINHLIEVAELIVSNSDLLDVNLVMAAFLHDVVEDTAVTPQELEQRFGHDVLSLVMEVTDDKSLPKEMRKAKQIENAHQQSPRAQILKLADKISNLRALLSSPPANWSVQRKLEYFEWARAVVSRLTDPNPALKAEFDRTYARIGELEAVK